MRLKAISIVILMLICSSSISFGQKANKKISITGTVLDADKKPIKGAIVFIDKIKTDVLTNSDGKYKVKVNAAVKEILIFTFLNGTAETKINGRTTIDFVLNTGNPSEDSGEDKKYGKLKGKLIDEIGVFKGVPYSGPSDGLNRFLPPTPLTQWDGIRDATNFIPIKSYQPPDNNLKERSTLIFALQCGVGNDPVRKIREKLYDLG